ncbi:MAG: hypothetical protein ACRDHL_08110 [Candidatus Promineifilaceae bacterium]
MDATSQPEEPSSQPLEIGRVLRASTAGFTVGCRAGQLSTPSFGSLLKAQPIDTREAVYGLIYDMHIDDDPLVRRLVLSEGARPSVISDQRDNRLLPIEMSVLSVGYRLDGRLYHSLPPRPPLNLDPVYLCDRRDDVLAFTDRPDYLRLILRAAGEVPVDQLLVAHIRHVYALRGRDEAWARRMLDEVIELLRSDYNLLTPVLDALSLALPQLG